MTRETFMDKVYDLLDTCDFNGSDVFLSPMEEDEVRNLLYEIRDILN